MNIILDFTQNSLDRLFIKDDPKVTPTGKVQLSQEQKLHGGAYIPNLTTRCQLKWRMQRQNHQFWKCYFFHIQLFKCLFIYMNRWNMNFFYKICTIALIQGPKSPKNGPFWTENGRRMAFLSQKSFAFVCQHVGPCLRSTQLFSVHLSCKIARLQVDLLAFYPKNGHF